MAQNPLPEKTLLMHQVRTDLETEPLEDGMAHQAEDTLLRTIGRIGEPTVLDTVEESLADENNPVLAAALIICLSGLDQPVGTPEWRAHPVAQAPRSKNLQIRDAAVQAAEHWQDPGLLTVLRQHHDDFAYMNQYVRGVIQDLTQERTPSTRQQHE